VCETIELTRIANLMGITAFTLHDWNVKTHYFFFLVVPGIEPGPLDL
jgi:hypothetical protein